MNTSLKRNPKFYNNSSVPDTDSRGIELSSQGNSVTLNLMYDHTRLQYTAPVGNTTSVSFVALNQAEERSLHVLTLNNAANVSAKSFIFSSSFVFLDTVVPANTIVVDAGKTAVYFGAVILGKMYFRESIESTN